MRDQTPPDPAVSDVEVLRKPLSAHRLTASAPARWRIEVVEQTESTNADLLVAAQSGAAEGLVRVAEYQRNGRGRLGRTWISPPGAGLTASILLRPTVDVARWGWLPLLAGVALAETIGPGAGLKWPNDVLLGREPGKVAGILVQAGPGVAVIGIGLNVSTQVTELPSAAPEALPATSLLLAGRRLLDREELLVRFLERLGRHYGSWQVAGGNARESGLAPAYERLCTTLRRIVKVDVLGSVMQATATTIDFEGRLVLEAGATRTAIAAGDVTHIRHPVILR